MPKQRRSTRKVRVRIPYGRERVVFEGHGEWSAINGWCTVPIGTSITFYTDIGCAIDDDLGGIIARNEGLPTSLPDSGLDADGDVDTTLGGASTGLSGHRRKYTASERVPNMTLLPPFDPPLAVSPGSVTVGAPTKLKELLETYKGSDCIWAACTVED